MWHKLRQGCSHHVKKPFLMCLEAINGNFLCSTLRFKRALAKKLIWNFIIFDNRAGKLAPSVKLSSSHDRRSTPAPTPKQVGLSPPRIR